MGSQFSFVEEKTSKLKASKMFMFLLMIKLVAANPVNFQSPGVTLTIQDCFPFCGVQSEVQQLIDFKNSFENCFPFCGVPDTEEKFDQCSSSTFLLSKLCNCICS